MMVGFIFISLFRVYGTNRSLTSHDEQRLMQSFEKNSDAVERTEKRQELINSGVVKEKSHTGKNYDLRFR